MLENYKKYGRVLRVDEDHFDELFGLFKKVTLKKSEYFLRAGAHCQHFGFVVDGALRSYYINENGGDKSYKFHLGVQVFTDYESIILNVKSKLNIQALKKSEIMLLHKDDMKKLETKEEYWVDYGRKITERMYLEAINRVEDFIYLSNENRYKKLLEENPLILSEVSLKHIATYLGVTPQSLSRIRNRLSFIT